MEKVNSKTCDGMLTHCYSCPHANYICNFIGIDLLMVNKGSLFLHSEKKIRCICFLVDNINKVITKEKLIDHVWNGVHISKSGLPVLIHEVRGILMKSNKSFVLQSIRGIGYILIDKTADLFPLQID